MSKLDIDATIAAVADAYDADILGYFGDIQRPEDDWLYGQCNRRRRRKNVILVVTTRGGDPHVAYRIARCLQQTYKTRKRQTGLGAAKEAEGKFILLVLSKCKSAGTIMALGATEIWMAPSAEFGPIDVQLRKPDEVGERTSGLTPIHAMQSLENFSLRMFKRHFTQLRFDSDLVFSTKMAADIATATSVGLLAPIFNQIDPIRLAEVDRSLRISAEYGERLGKDNLKDDALERLLAKYPAHGFVIDRWEADDIFKNIADPPADLQQFAEIFEVIGSMYLDKNESYFYYLSKEPAAPEVANDQNGNSKGDEVEQEATPEDGAQPAAGAGPEQAKEKSVTTSKKAGETK